MVVARNAPMPRAASIKRSLGSDLGGLFHVRQAAVHAARPWPQTRQNLGGDRISFSAEPKCNWPRGQCANRRKSTFADSACAEFISVESITDVFEATQKPPKNQAVQARINSHGE